LMPCVSYTEMAARTQMLCDVTRLYLAILGGIFPR
jgi:hypothetical protein